MCTTKEERKEIFAEHPMIKELCPVDKPWMEPTYHDLDSLVMKFPLSWAFGKFAPCEVPDLWKRLPTDFEGADPLTQEMHEIYKGICWLTVGNVILCEESKKCLLIKDIVHCDWNPSVLPRENETLMDYHKEMVKECKGWMGDQKNYSDYIEIKPVTKLICQELLVDWRSFRKNDAQANLVLKEEELDPKLSLHEVYTFSKMIRFLSYNNTFSKMYGLLGVPYTFSKMYCST